MLPSFSAMGMKFPGERLGTDDTLRAGIDNRLQEDTDGIVFYRAFERTLDSAFLVKAAYVFAIDLDGLRRLLHFFIKMAMRHRDAIHEDMDR